MCMCGFICWLGVEDALLIVYHNPDEKPPGGMRFLLITCRLPFNDGTVVLISPDL